ncbi:hypothetical protein HOLleu_20866 [Holothuria leucospilota]|uniref:Ankyrin repeat domain-containing protein n=1 Tax=Holothuria leucospilota TaxID=206669 RepID=A0A9Q1BWR3_HOLLE|nr:hypothetical protein HOLleu_20866 [Holothuria leucospilota]
MDDFKYNDSLWGAAMNGNIDRVREILSDPAGIAQINQTNKYGYTPLQLQYAAFFYYKNKRFLIIKLFNASPK